MLARRTSMRLLKLVEQEESRQETPNADIISYFAQLCMTSFDICVDSNDRDDTGRRGAWKFTPTKVSIEMERKRQEKRQN